MFWAGGSCGSFSEEERPELVHDELELALVLVPELSGLVGLDAEGDEGEGEFQLREVVLED